MRRQSVHPLSPRYTFTFTPPRGSLVCVSRRVRWDWLGASDLSKHRDYATTPTSLSADTASRPHRSEAVVVAIRHVACAAWAKAATLLSLQCVTLRGPEPRPEGLGHLPCTVPGAPETAADRFTLSAAEGNKRSLPAAGPKAIPRPEGAHRPSCTCRGLSWPHSLPSQPFHSLFDSFQSAYHLSLLVLVAERRERSEANNRILFEILRYLYIYIYIYTLIPILSAGGIFFIYTS